MIEISEITISGIAFVSFLAGYGFALVVQAVRNRMP
jgi:hypothetical protein